MIFVDDIYTHYLVFLFHSLYFLCVQGPLEDGEKDGLQEPLINSFNIFDFVEILVLKLFDLIEDCGHRVRSNLIQHKDHKLILRGDLMGDFLQIIHISIAPGGIHRLV